MKLQDAKLAFSFLPGTRFSPTDLGRTILHMGTYPEGPRLVFSSSEGWKFCVCSLGPRNHSLSSLNSTLLSPQDTADYVKPVAFSVEYSLEDPDNGPMLDNGWPTTLRVSVRPTPLSP